MTDRWAWSRERAVLGYRLTLARHRTPGQLFAAFSIDRETVIMSTEVWAAQEFGDDPMVRAGQVGEWGFAFEAAGTLSSEDDVMISLSEGTETLVVVRVATGFGWFGYARDGVLVTGLDLNAPDRADGTDPERFAGLLGPDRDHVVSALQMIESEFQVTVTDDVLRGTLLTGRRAPDMSWLDD